MKKNYQEEFELCYSYMTPEEKEKIDIKKQNFLDNSDFIYYNMYLELVSYIKSAMPQVYLDALNSDAKHRVQLEIESLQSNISKLSIFMTTSNYSKLSYKSKFALKEQLSIMRAYVNILKYRLTIWEEIK